jgi:hypothetical protein
MRRINWDTVGFIFIILGFFALTHAVSFGFGRAYEKKILSQKSPSMAQCMKYWGDMLKD